MCVCVDCVQNGVGERVAKRMQYSYRTTKKIKKNEFFKISTITAKRDGIVRIHRLCVPTHARTDTNTFTATPSMDRSFGMQQPKQTALTRATCKKTHRKSHTHHNRQQSLARSMFQLVGVCATRKSFGRARTMFAVSRMSVRNVRVREPFALSTSHATWVWKCCTASIF